MFFEGDARSGSYKVRDKRTDSLRTVPVKQLVTETMEPLSGLKQNVPVSALPDKNKTVSIGGMQ